MSESQPIQTSAETAQPGTGDAWSALQAQGVEANDSAASGIAPAYSGYNDRGEPFVGFDRAMQLPSICMKCGDPSSSTIAHKLTVDSRSQRLYKLFMNSKSRMRTTVAPLVLPYCERCRKKRASILKLCRFSDMFPFIALLTLFAASAVMSQVPEVLLLICLAGWPVLHKLSRFRAERWLLAIERFDDDGFVRLLGVHPLAGESVVAAAEEHRRQATATLRPTPDA